MFHGTAVWVPLTLFSTAHAPATSFLTFPCVPWQPGPTTGELCRGGKGGLEEKGELLIAVGIS